MDDHHIPGNIYSRRMLILITLDTGMSVAMLDVVVIRPYLIAQAQKEIPRDFENASYLKERIPCERALGSFLQVRERP